VRPLTGLIGFVGVAVLAVACLWFSAVWLPDHTARDTNPRPETD
jgi:hypothetical protein